MTPLCLLDGETAGDQRHGLSSTGPEFRFPADGSWLIDTV
jgi:hypothetical protein